MRAILVIQLIAWRFHYTIREFSISSCSRYVRLYVRGNLITSRLVHEDLSLRSVEISVPVTLLLVRLAHCTQLAELNSLQVGGRKVRRGPDLFRILPILVNYDAR